MYESYITLKDLTKKGDHVSSVLVQTACRFDSSITVQYENRKINAKSLMGVLSFPFEENMDLKIQATGSDEKEAAEAIAAYLG